MPPHRIDPRIDPAPNSSPFSFLFLWVKKAYMPIDANQISNLKDR